MIACSNDTCSFWVHMHSYEGVNLDESIPCPWCGSRLNVEEEIPYWTGQRLGIRPEDLTFHGKVVLNRVEKMARELNVPKEQVLRVAQQGCGGCVQRAKAVEL